MGGVCRLLLGAYRVSGISKVFKVIGFGDMNLSLSIRKARWPIGGEFAG